MACLWSALLLPGLLGCPASSTPTSDSGEPAGDKKRIVILTNGDDPFWDACEAGAMHAEEELGLAGQGYVVTFDRPVEFADKAQVDKIKQYALDKNLVGLGISIYNPDSPSVYKELKALQERGVQVVTIDGDINREKYRDGRYAYLGTENIIAGRELGKAARALTPEGSKYAFFVGNTGSANAIARMTGFTEGAGTGFTEVERLEDLGDRPTARKNVQDALDRHPEINMLVGIWAYNTPQAVAVVKTRNIRDKEKVLCFDADRMSINGMKDGQVDAMLVQNPYQMGFVGVQLLKALVEKDQKFIDGMYPDYAQEGTRDLFNTELRIVVPGQETPIKADAFSPGTVYMTIEEFEKWLHERDLTSS
jgi:ribose transport system substrate-binding protein